MTELTRRRMLSAAAAAGAVAVAGCSGSADEGNGGESDGTVLGDIVVLAERLTEQTHTVDVLVEFEDEIEHWSTHELEAGSERATVERDWPTEPGDFRVTVRLDGDEFTQVTPEQWNEPDCINLFTLIEQDGTLTISSDTGGGPCGTGDPDPNGNESEE